ncbi:EAL domain-containing protein [bacterium]|nr:EAL domain-containing protein [bacterium]
MIETSFQIWRAHEPLYIALALVLCVSGTIVTGMLLVRATDTEGPAGLIWTLMTGLIAGATIWTTHFVAMLGYHSDAITGYDPLRTFLSLMIGVLTSSCAFMLAKYVRGRLSPDVAGLLFGSGIAMMHYSGVWALQIHGDIRWNSAFVLLSIFLACAFGLAGLNRSRSGREMYRPFQAAGAFALAILSLHFTAMAAMEILPAGMPDGSQSIDSGQLAFYVAIVIVALLAMSSSAFTLDTLMAARSREQCNYFALHDPLTGLPNRTYVRQIVTGIAAARDSGSKHSAGVVFDLDRLKEINDVHGHAVGDGVLCALANRLNHELEADEFVGRFGGDEFVAIKRVISDRGDAHAFAERLRELVARPFEVEGRVLEVSASLGVVVYPDDGTSAANLLERADMAMYRAKNTGRNRVCMFDAAIEKLSCDRSELGIELNQALNRREFRLVYQKQNAVRTGEVVGYEALLRWDHPKKGAISPGEFIPVAEETGFIVTLGEWALRAACKEAAGWSLPLRVAVNIAPQQLGSAKFCEIVQSALRESGLDPCRLELEITETGVVRDHARAIQTIETVRKLGVRVAMDDYGTGYSSLSTLRQLSFDKIKVDREFVSGLPGDGYSVAIFEATLALTRNLGLKILAEGVETEEQLAYLRDRGCNEAQGFLFGRPLEVDDVRLEIASQALRQLGPATQIGSDIAELRRAYG